MVESNEKFSFYVQSLLYTLHGPSIYQISPSSLTYHRWFNITPFDYNPVLPKLSKVMTKHHRTMLRDNPDLKKVFSQPPMASLRQGPNLRKLLCRAILPKLSRNPSRATHRTSAGWRRCSSTTGRQCPICPLTPVSALSVTSHLTGYNTHIP